MPGVSFMSASDGRCEIAGRNGSGRGWVAAKIWQSRRMSADKPMKSSYELAMERLKKSDKDAGVVWEPLTDAQKAAIAEIRTFYEAKLAELGILHQASLRKIYDPAEREALNEEQQRERERLIVQRDIKIAEIRQQT